MQTGLVHTFDTCCGCDYLCHADGVPEIPGNQVEAEMSLVQTGVLLLNSTNPSETTGRDTSTFTRVTFPTPFPRGSRVIVTANVQTFNGPQTPGLRISDVTEAGFLIRLNELVVNGSPSALSDGLHAEETIGWIAATA